MKKTPTTNVTRSTSTKKHANVPERSEYRLREKATLAANSKPSSSSYRRSRPEVEEKEGECSIHTLSASPEIPVANQPRRLTLQLIRLRALNEQERNLGTEAMADALLTKRILRLDSLNLSQLDNLEVFSLKELYVHNNHLKKIENLEEQRELVLLSLSSNQITKVEKLLCLKNLQLLDLSHNQVEHLDIAELPASLRTLDLRGNPVCSHPSYPQVVLNDLPNLQRLDGCRINRSQNERPRLLKEREENDPPSSASLAAAHEDNNEDDDEVKSEERGEEKEGAGEEGERGRRVRQAAASLKAEHDRSVMDLEREIQELLDLDQSRLHRKLQGVQERREQAEKEGAKLVDSARGGQQRQQGLSLVAFSASGAAGSIGSSCSDSDRRMEAREGGEAEAAYAEAKSSSSSSAEFCQNIREKAFKRIEAYSSSCGSRGSKDSSDSSDHSSSGSSSSSSSSKKDSSGSSGSRLPSTTPLALAAAAERKEGRCMSSTAVAAAGGHSLRRPPSAKGAGLPIPLATTTPRAIVVALDELDSKGEYGDDDEDLLTETCFK